jgi:hypothetical protein
MAVIGHERRAIITFFVRAFPTQFITYRMTYPTRLTYTWETELRSDQD